MIEDTKIIVAVVGSATSLLVAIISFLSSHASKKKVLQLQNRLDTEKAIKNARLDYEYDAKKRLYEECEPILFQLAEQAENAIHRVYSLARTARQGNLGPDNISWLGQDGYYLQSTIYNLLSPMTAFRLLQQRLTMIDLAVEQHIQREYKLLKLLYISSTEDFGLAEIEPSLEYNPNTPDWRQKIKTRPDVYRRQGIVIGHLDRAIDLMISDDPERPRCMGFGEFQDKLSHDEDFKKAFSYIGNEFLHFHPKTMPVLWRILITQVLLYCILLRNQRERRNPDIKKNLSFEVPEDVIENTEWSNEENTAAMMFEIAENYLKTKHGEIFSE